MVFIETMVNFGERLSNILKAKKVTQKWLAEQLNRPSNVINAWIMRNIEPDMDTLYKISQIFNAPIGYFFGEIELDQIDEEYNRLYSKYKAKYLEVRKIADQKKYAVYTGKRAQFFLREASEWIFGEPTFIAAFMGEIPTYEWYGEYLRGNLSEPQFWDNLCSFFEEWKQKAEDAIKK